jgi:hypothetical protein
MQSTANKLLMVATIIFLVSAPVFAQRGAAGNASKDAAVTTPRTADGTPDLTGLWNGPAAGGGPAVPAAEVDRDAYGAVGFDPNLLVARHAEGRNGPDALINFERDNTLVTRMGANKPIYKPKYWETVKKLDQNGNTEDPSYGCLPAGVPREGPPVEIIQTAKKVYFLFPGGGGQIAVPASYRVIPIDGRKHSNLEDLDGSWYGEAIGHWDGDTLVVDTIGFNASTWLDIEGYFHSENMHVIERLTRNGNDLTWQATVEDPDVFLQPWEWAPRTVHLNPNPNALIPEALPCSDRDLVHTVTKEHH